MKNPELKPGPELDQEIATKVMGYVKRDYGAGFVITEEEMDGAPVRTEGPG